jgi:hypothetical protein
LLDHIVRVCLFCKRLLKCLSSVSFCIHANNECELLFHILTSIWYCVWDFNHSKRLHRAYITPYGFVLILVSNSSSSCLCLSSTQACTTTPSCHCVFNLRFSNYSNQTSCHMFTCHLDTSFGEVYRYFAHFLMGLSSYCWVLNVLYSLFLIPTFTGMYFTKISS